MKLADEMNMAIINSKRRRREIAKDIGITESYLCNICKGKRRMTLKIAIKLADTLKIDYEYIKNKWIDEMAQNQMSKIKKRK